MTVVIAAQPRTRSHYLAERLGFEPLEILQSRDLSHKLAAIKESKRPGFVVHDYQWYCNDGLSLWNYWRPNRVIWLSREDAFEQAASHFVSSQTGQWMGKHGTAMLQLDPAGLIRRYASLVASRANVMAKLGGIPCTCTTYENIMFEGEIRRLAAFSRVTKTYEAVKTSPSDWKQRVSNLDQAREAFWSVLKC